MVDGLGITLRDGVVASFDGIDT